MSDARTIAAVVRHHRLRLGITHLELSQRVGCTEATIQSIEAGRVASPRNPKRLAEALGITIDELFTGKGSRRADVS